MYSSGIMGLNTPNTVGMGPDQMYPGSQQVPSQYATPSQAPISSSALNASYEAKTDPYTGEMKLANGGIAALRYDDGGDVQQPQAPVYSNDDNGNLVDSSGKIVATAEARNDPYIQSTFFNPKSAVATDPAEAQAFY